MRPLMDQYTVIYWTQIAVFAEMLTDRRTCGHMRIQTHGQIGPHKPEIMPCPPPSASGVDFDCKCKPGFGGIRCEMVTPRACSTRPCLNGGTCIPMPYNTFKCACNARFTGTASSLLNSFPCLKTPSNVPAMLDLQVRHPACYIHSHALQHLQMRLQLEIFRHSA